MIYTSYIHHIYIINTSYIHHIYIHTPHLSLGLSSTACQVQPALSAPADLPPRHDASAASPAGRGRRGARALGCGIEGAAVLLLDAGAMGAMGKIWG